MLSDAAAQHLLQKAQEAANLAYAPYSHFQVGAALLVKDNTILTGVNVENVSYGLTICAERTVIFKAISEGYRDFQAIAVWAAYADAENPKGNVTPCGACRQVMAEFFDPKTVVVYNDANGQLQQRPVGILLPEAFA